LPDPYANLREAPVEIQRRLANALDTTSRHVRFGVGGKYTQPYIGTAAEFRGSSSGGILRGSKASRGPPKSAEQFGRWVIPFQ